MEDFFVVDIPVFLPKYNQDKKYGWSKYKDNLWEVLRETSKGYCMYCYDSVWINGQRRGQIEHGIEKANSPEYLMDCVPNLGLACENCNGRYKRRGETKRKLSLESINKFKQVECKKFDCKEPCEKFKELHREYSRNGEIIIHPFATKVQEQGNELRLQYDLLKCKYVPSKTHGNYNEEELDIIAKHIKLFELNSPKRKNYEVGRYCKNVIDNKSIMEGIEYNNLVVDLFREKLQRLDIETAVKVCEVVYGNAMNGLAT